MIHLAKNYSPPQATTTKTDIAGLQLMLHTILSVQKMECWLGFMSAILMTIRPEQIDSQTHLTRN